MADYRFSFDKNLASLYEKLRNDEDLDISIFDTNKDIFLLSACLAFKYGKKRKPLNNRNSDKAINIQRFEKYQLNMLAIDLIALAETKDLGVLLDNEEKMKEKIEIIEEYANAGIEILKEKLINRQGAILENLIELITKQCESNISTKKMLEEINQDF